MAAGAEQGLYQPDLLEGLRRGAASLLDEWGLSPRTRVSLLNISENATFRADDPDRPEPVILRVHRPDYHDDAEIGSELAWIAALRAERVVTTPEPLPCRSGGMIAHFDHHGARRNVVAFTFAHGREPAPSDDLLAGFHDLGAISARLHRHARSWPRPARFTRKTWDFAAVAGRRAHWGDWRAASGLTPDGRAMLDRAAKQVADRLDRYGVGPDRFGLIHADLRLANLLIDDAGAITVIDFDDCGFGWFAFDFAAAVSFFEDDPVVPDLQQAWIAGYREIAPFDAETDAEMPTFVLLRRLQLTAWLTTHAETPTARDLGPTYCEGTLTLAERYLAAT